MPGASTRSGILATQNNSVATSNNGRGGSLGVRQLDSSWDDSSKLPGQAPAKADAAPSGSTTTVFTGLCDAINEFQQSLVKPGGYEIADVYEIQFAPSSMADATVALDGTAYKATPTAQQKTPNAQLNQDTQRMDITGRIVQVGLGTQIVQFIDQVMRSSSYITDQSNFIIDEATGQLKPKPSAPSDAELSWYNISFQAESLGWDAGRNDYAYKMIYTVTPYAINRMDSQYFPEGRYRGVHKSYNYWFTGKNNAVLNFEQEYNNMYFTILSQTAGGTGTGPIAGLTNTQADSANDPIGKTTSKSQIPKSYAPAASVSNQGAANGANEIGASAADYLYAMSPQGEIKLRIIGDPAWIPQGEITNSVNAQSFTFSPFLPDGTINVDASEVMFDIYFNRPADYNFETGVVNVNGQTINPGGTLAALQPQAHLTYTCTGVKSFFMQGKFEQELTGKAYLDGFTQAIQKSADQSAAREENANAVAEANGTRDSSIKPIDQLNPDLWDSVPSTPSGDITNRTPGPATIATPPSSNGDLTQIPIIDTDTGQQLNTQAQTMAPKDE